MQIFHVLNRGVDQRKIFLDKQDHFRFIHDLYEFNDERRVESAFRTFIKNPDIASREMKVRDKKGPRKLLVNLYAFSLMPNHYHLLLEPRVENGIFKFVKKLNMGYAKYFNERYKRKGTLFQGRYKSIHITNDTHFYHLPNYIHLNPLDLILPQWRNRALSSKEYEKAESFLKSYRWSSYLDWTGGKNFPSLINKDFLERVCGNEKKYQQFLKEWLCGSTEIKQIDLDLSKFE